MTATILVVDDDDDVRGLIAELLEDAGHRVVATGDPTQAVSVARSVQPDLVICDVAMPVMDGYGVVRALQADPATAACPVVFLTARQQFTERVKAFRFGIVDYVAKPFTRETLTRKVARILGGLHGRPGILAGESSAALLEQAQFEGRSGVLTLEGGEARLLLAAGRVVDATAVATQVGVRPGAFRELDPTLEQATAPGGEAAADRSLPDVSDLPAALRTALVVDDDATFRMALRCMLEKLGFAVHEAEDGATGLQTAIEQLPWLILTDVRMPVMDGLELCRHLRGHALLRRTPVVFLSGLDGYKERYRSFEAGGDEFLSKQTPADEILIRIRLVLGRYARLGGAVREAGAGLSGELGLIGSPNLLQMCNAGRLTGTLTVRSGAAEISVRFRDGEIVGALGAERRDAEAIHELLGWSRGHFAFQPGDPGPGRPVGASFMQVLLDGCRLLDEQQS